MNPIIQKARDALIAKIDPRLQPVVQKVLSAGKQVMYSEQTRSLAVQELKKGTDPESVGAAVSKLAAILFNQSKHTIPMNVLLPATMLLLFEALEFLEEAGTLQVDAAQLAEYSKATGSAFLQMLGVTPEKLQGMLASQGEQPGRVPDESVPGASGDGDVIPENTGGIVAAAGA